MQWGATGFILQIADLKTSNDRVQKLEQETFKTGFWDEPKLAQGIMQEMNDVKAQIQQAQDLEQMLGDMDAAIELAHLEVICSFNSD